MAADQTTTCPIGHESTWDDYCSSCGAAMGGAPGSAPGSAPDGGPEAAPAGTSAEPRCPNCAEPHAANAVFCENCGYDFLAGSMPGALSDPDPAIAGPAAALSDLDAASPSGWELHISADRGYFDRMSAEGQLSFPDPPPDPTVLALSLQKALLGRRSESRGVFPELDILALTDDPAVSTRHAMLDQRPDGGYTITDLSSTNGTYIDDATDPVTPGMATPLNDGAVIYLGAWTRIELRST